MIEIQLSNGAYLRVRPMPPHVVVQFNQNVAKAMPPEPEAPRKRVKMADGHIEDDVVSEDSPEWEEYQKARAAWQRECNELIVDANDEYNILQRDYAVIEWSFNGEHWQTDVPETWELPAALTRAGLSTCGNRRVDFIGIELLTTTDDWAAVRDVSEGQTSSITDEEAAQVRAGFRARYRRTRDAAPKKRGWFGRLALALSRGDGGGEGVELDA